MPFKPFGGIGPSNAKIMLVGEAPGADESIAEEPFVGQCGRMLTKMLESADIKRDSIYICNTVNCRPTDDGKKNRPPNKNEINLCKNWLYEQIDCIKPKLIITLGKVPTQTVLEVKNLTLKDFIGNFYKYELNNQSYTVLPNYHPSFCMIYGKKEVQTAINIFKKGSEYVNN